MLFKPPGFDPSHRYPLLHWVYGGPQMRIAPSAFALRGDNDLLHHALADAGYLVLVLDARGTPQRSKAFQDLVWRSFVDHVVADQAGALRQLDSSGDRRARRDHRGTRPQSGVGGDSTQRAGKVSDGHDGSVGGRAAEQDHAARKSAVRAVYVNGHWRLGAAASNTKLRHAWVLGTVPAGGWLDKSRLPC